MLAFWLLLKSGVYPPELKAINLDLDWFYRRALGGYVIPWVFKVLEGANQIAFRVFIGYLPRVLAVVPHKLPKEVLGLMMLFVRPFLNKEAFARLEERAHMLLEAESSSVSMALAVAGIFVIWIFL
jgi:multicomponent Na+:H+ antiporter subunit D